MVDGMLDPPMVAATIAAAICTLLAGVVLALPMVVVTPAPLPVGAAGVVEVVTLAPLPAGAAGVVDVVAGMMDLAEDSDLGHTS